MNISRGTIIYVAVLVLIFVGLAVAYQFVLQAQTQQYAEAEQFSKELESKSTSLANRFGQTDPQAVIDEYRQQIDPWREAAESRIGQFEMTQAIEPEEIPEGKLPRFHYEERYNEIMQAFWRDLQQRGMTQAVSLTGGGGARSSMGGGMGGMGMGGMGGGGMSGSGGIFGAQDPSQIAGAAIEEDQINYWLWRLRLGIETVDMMLDAGAVYIGGIDIWDKRTEYGVLESYTVGLYFAIPMQDLLEFTNRVLTAPESYYRIDGLRISNRNLVGSANPILEVEMLLTRSGYVEGGSPTTSRGRASTSSGAGGFGGDMMMDPFGMGMPGMGMPGMGPGGEGRSKSRRPPSQAKKSWWENLWPF